MAYETFYEQFGELAWKETRSISVFDDPRLAGDDFGFIEACDKARYLIPAASSLN